ncbi:SDR family oxidoreductase [Actinomycetes bacterium M1A6_2h]
MSDNDVRLITGAAGGMGFEVARRTGPGVTALITDISPAKVDAAVAKLTDAGVDAAGIAGDLTERGFVDALGDLVVRTGTLRELVHTAGLWDTTTDPARVFDINYRATVDLLNRMTPHLNRGSVAICIASIGAHRRKGRSVVESLFADPSADAVWDRAQQIYHDRMTPTVAYSVAKRGVIRECERRSGVLAAQGVRIISVSPGNFETPMGQDARATGGANLFADAAIERRPGRPADVADLVEFLASERASYITGCDIRIDGGAIPALREENANPAFLTWDAVLDA